MSDDGGESPKGSPDPFDVVMIHGPTEDGQGARVLRARPGQLEAGEMRPLQSGKPLTAGEIVRLQRRADAPALFDVHVEHRVEPPKAPSGDALPARRHVGHGPAQVATEGYRESWERIFGSRGSDAPN